MTALPSAPGRPLARRLRRDLLLVALATLLGGALRLWGLDLAPPGLHPDEAANAFEASCLRGLGAASDGRAWPLTFCMHGRFWVEGTYVWLVALAQGLPLSLAVQTRLPAALAGTALIPLAALLARRLVAPRAGWIAAALLAVEPLAVHYSRVGLRASLTPPLVAGALVLLLAPPRAPARDAARGALAGALASLALWTYTPMRAWVPLLLAAWVLAYRPRARRAPWAPALALGLVTLAFLAALPWTLAGDGSARLSEVSLTHQDGGPLALGARFLRGYALAFAPRALLSGSSGARVLGRGVTPLLWTSAPLILLGLARLARRLPTPRALPLAVARALPCPAR
ncbi:MAG: glycosyltransferase family 39 protein [Planctomycetota bacterium]